MLVAILITFYRLQPLIGFGNYSPNRAMGNGHARIGKWAMGIKRSFRISLAHLAHAQCPMPFCHVNLTFFRICTHNYPDESA